MKHIITIALLILGLHAQAQYLYVTEPTYTFGRPELVQAYSGEGRCISLRDRGTHSVTTNQFIDVRYWSVPGQTNNPRHAIGHLNAGTTYNWWIQPGWLFVSKVGSDVANAYPLHLYGSTIYDTIILEFPTCNALATVNGFGGSYWCDHAILLPANGLHAGTVTFEGVFDADEDFRFRPCRISSNQ